MILKSYIKLMKYFISIAMVVLMLLFARSNNQSVIISLFPFSTIVKVKLFILMMTIIIIGFLLGYMIGIMQNNKQ